MGHRHFPGDPYTLSGVWGHPTSAANFCEEDYAFTRYIAEFINALTNLPYIYFALKYMYTTRPTTPKPPSSVLSTILPKQTDFMSTSLLFLGISSLLYHTTLLQPLQSADDLSMLVLSWSLVQSTLTIRQSPFRVKLITGFLALITPCVAAIYLHTGDVNYHVAGFSVMLVVSAIRAQWLFHVSDLGLDRGKVRGWNRRLWKYVGLCVVGYTLWNVDMAFCMELRKIRGRVGLPWAWVVELHGWWHVLTAVGAGGCMEVAREVWDEVKRGGGSRRGIRGRVEGKGG